MADKVTQKDGKWSDTTVWNGGTLPTSGQTIQISHNIEYDYDNTGHAAGYGAIAIDAGKYIYASTTAGAYVMKLAGNVTGGAGSEIRAGDAVNAYPTNCTFTIYINGNYSIDGGTSNTLTFKFYCYDPPVKYLRLLSASPKAITGISKGTTCTVTCVGHGYSAGDTIYLVNVGGMVELNNLRVKVKTVLGADSFTLRAYDADVVIDSTPFTTYTTGGYACPETAEAIGQTQLEVDQNVSADPEWTRSGATVNIDNVNRGKDSESRTIQSVAAGSVTVTSGLTAAKHSSSLVILTSRNVTLQSSATNITNGIVYRGSGHVLQCACKPGGTGTHAFHQCVNTTFSGVASGGDVFFNQCTGSTFSGVGTGTAGNAYGIIGGSSNTMSGLLSGIYQAMYLVTRSIISGVVSGAFFACDTPTADTISGEIIGCYYAISASSGCRISGMVKGSGMAIITSWSAFNGKVIGCGTAILGCNDVKITGAIYGCMDGIYNSSFWAAWADLAGNAYDVRLSTGRMTNCRLASATENYDYNSAISVTEAQYLESFDHDRIPGAFRAWTRGGITSSTATNPPTGRVRSYQHVCESASYPCWHQREIVVDAGRQLRVRVWLKGDAGVEIKAQLVLPTADPLITGSGTGEWQQIGTSGAAWHEYTTAWTNSATYPVTICLRFLATAASGNGYSDFQWAFDRTPLVR